MRFFLSSLLASFLLISCSTNNKPQLQATIKKVDDSSAVYLGKLGDNGSRILMDTTQVINGKFSFNLPEEDFAHLYIISIEGLKGNMLFINNQMDIKATMYKDSLQKSKIEGGRANRLFHKYLEHLWKNRDRRIALREKYNSYEILSNAEKKKKAQEAQKEIIQDDLEFRKEFIKKHPKSLVSALILSDMAKMKALSFPKIKELYASLDKKVQRSISGQTIQKKINSAMATAVGSKAPGFSAKTPKGNTLSLKESLGEKYTILDFWASWCKPCRMASPHFVRIYNKYNSKGLNILSVSLDKRKDRWVQAIKADNLNWQHVSNLQFWNGPITEKYNIHAIPATFILDEDGTIVAKGLRGNALDKKLKELFNQQ